MDFGGKPANRESCGAVGGRFLHIDIDGADMENVQIAIGRTDNAFGKAYWYSKT